MELKVANMVLTGKLSFKPPSFDKIMEQTKYRCHYDERYVAGMGIYINNSHVSLFKNGTVVVKGVTNEKTAQDICKLLIEELRRINKI
jgi:TATA-box binding protein (TBP) (component of TFIID and TFIIIB)